MLLSLHIENVAVIKRLDVDLSGGFTALTGETGAGKSIIIDCIALIMGGRADKSLIRHGETRAGVSAVFGSLGPTTLEKLAEYELAPDEEGTILVSRVFSADSHASIRINSQPITISALRDIMSTLITIHGQSDSSALTKKSQHIELLDSFSGNGKLLAAYSDAYKRMISLRKALLDMDKEDEERDRAVDMLKYQIAEISKLKLKVGEEEALAERLDKLKNIELIAQKTSFTTKALKDADRGNVVYLLDRTMSALSALSDMFPEMEEYIQTLDECKVRIDDVAETVRDYMGDFDSNPTELIDRIQNRLDAIDKLKRKYGGSIEAVLEYLERAKERLDRYENSQIIREDVVADIKECEKQLSSYAKELRESRLRSARVLESAVCESLEFLDMPRVRFICRVADLTENGSRRYDRYGYDDIAFMISANAGMEPMPLDKIASGGELARIMLSIKSVFASADAIQTVIYDEIDAGVSGKTARKIGLKLLEGAKDSQVLCVTHSAQIASLADTHFLISKREDEGSTLTTLTELDESGRIDELSRILGGINVTDAQRMAAIDMRMGKK